MFGIIPRQWCAHIRLTLCLTKLRTIDNVGVQFACACGESVRNAVYNAWYCIYCIYYIIFKSFTENFWNIQGMLHIEFWVALCVNLGKLKLKIKQHPSCWQERSKEFSPLNVGWIRLPSQKYMNWFHNATLRYTTHLQPFAHRLHFDIEVTWSLEICHFNILTWNGHKMLYDKMKLFIFFSKTLKCIYSAHFLPTHCCSLSKRVFIWAEGETWQCSNHHFYFTFTIFTRTRSFHKEFCMTEGKE